MPLQPAERPTDITHFIARYSQNAVIPHHPGEFVERSLVDETAIPMPALRPGIGKQQKDAIDGSVRQPRQKHSRIAGKKPDIP